MSSHSKAWVLPFLALAFLFAASCASANPGWGGEGSLAAAISEGLIHINEESAAVTEYTLAEVTRGSITRYTDVSVRVVSASERNLHFAQNGGRLAEIHVNLHQQVKKGDVLAEIVFDNEALETERRQLALRISQFERQNEAEHTWRYHDLENRRAAEYYPDDWELHLLAIARAELDYEKFLYDSGITRLQFERQLADIDERLIGEQIIAPFDGMITFIASVAPGTLVHTWTRIFTIVDDSALQFAASASMEVLRYGDVLTLINREETLALPVRVVSDPSAVPGRESSYNFILMPADPADNHYLASLFEMTIGNMRTALRVTPKVQHAGYVLKVPQAAVHPERHRDHYVLVYENGVIGRRYVRTGISQNREVQILSGLDLGQMVVVLN
jgi:RND family efflux transporter MFP subunit